MLTLSRALAALLLFVCVGSAQTGRFVLVGTGPITSRPTTCTQNRDIYLCNGVGCNPNNRYHYCVAPNQWDTTLPSGAEFGIVQLNGLSTTNQTFQTATDGTDFNISSAAGIHKFSLPSASATTRGALTAADWQTFNLKMPNPLQQIGDMVYFGPSGVTRLPKGTLDQCIRQGATAPYWGSCAAGGGGAWGSISGTLTDQTDLVAALAAKSNISHTHAQGDVTGLGTALTARPTKAAGFGQGAAIIDGSGNLDKASGSASDCVRVDGSSGPCGTGGGGSGALATSVTFAGETTKTIANPGFQATAAACFNASGNLDVVPTNVGTSSPYAVTFNPGVAYTGKCYAWQGGASGTVTSVAVSMPAEFSVASSPVTSAGTIAVSKAAQTANTVYAGPTSGGAAAPAFRSLVAGDIPSLSSVYLPLTGGTLSGQLIGAASGVEFTESDTNPTCASGNFTIYADLSENKLKKCQNGTASDLDTTGGSSVNVLNNAGSTVVSAITALQFKNGSGINWTITDEGSGVASASPALDTTGLLTLSGTQTAQNKTLDNTNTATLRDDRLTLQDDVDVTKQLRFQLSGITTATTRTVTVPDGNGTMMYTTTPVAASQLPNPTVGTKGGVEAKTCTGTDKISAIGTDGIPVCGTDQTGGGGVSIDGSSATWTDDFLSLPAASVQFGELAWRSTNWAGTGDAGGLDAEDNHPGMIHVTSGATSGDHTAIATSHSALTKNMISAGAFDSYWIVKTGSAVTNAAYFVGYSHLGDMSSTSRNLKVKFDTAASDTTWKFQACGEGSCTTVDSGVSVTANTWYKFRIRSTSSGTILFSVNGGSESSITTNLPDGGLTTTLYPGFGAKTNTAATRRLIIDYWSFQKTVTR